jgi:hypothetical protein
MRSHKEIAKESGGSVAPSLVLGIQIEAMERALEIVERNPVFSNPEPGNFKMLLSRRIEDALRQQVNTLRRLR